jgi:two-component system, cell cycle response regulator
MPRLTARPPAGHTSACDGTITASASPTFKVSDHNPLRSETQEANLVLIYPTGPRLGTRYPLADTSNLVGRTEDCQVYTPDGSVSRCHARIVREEDGRYRVIDLDSSNGTFVNNVLVKSTVLRDGDYLRFGNCIYRFLGGGNIENEYHEEIFRLTVLDGLTHVHNRRYLTEFLDLEVTRSCRHHRPLAVVMLDLDHFKQVNDRMGHLAGDMALQELCTRVQTAVRPGDLLARYGGEEFVVVLPETDAVTAAGIAERIRAEVAHRPFTFNTTRYQQRVSAGVATTDGKAALTVADLLQTADENLYRAKACGRDRILASPAVSRPGAK